MDVNTEILASGFKGSLDPQSLIADAFTFMEARNEGVEGMILHPSLQYWFRSRMCMLDGNLGPVWGADVTTDSSAPRNGFCLVSESYRVSFEGPDFPDRVEDLGRPVVLYRKAPVRMEHVVDLLDCCGRDPGEIQIVVSPRRYADILKFGRDALNLECLRSELQKGVRGTFLGVRVLTSLDVEDLRIMNRDQTEVYGILDMDPARVNHFLREGTERVLAEGIPERWMTEVLKKVEDCITVEWEGIAREVEDSRLLEVKAMWMQELEDRFGEVLIGTTWG